MFGKFRFFSAARALIILVSSRYIHKVFAEAGGLLMVLSARRLDCVQYDLFKQGNQHISSDRVSLGI